MRIIGGVGKGRRLTSPPGTTRPTTDRVREAVFNSLAMMVDWPTTHMLDLYAGSGAVGLEAASRGAASVMAIEKHSGALATVRANLRTLPEIRGKYHLLASTVETALARPPQRPHHYGMVYIDPPYAEVNRAIPPLLDQLSTHQWLEDGALVVVEYSARDKAIEWPEPYDCVKTKTYGETRIDYAEWCADHGDTTPSVDDEEKTA